MYTLLDIAGFFVVAGPASFVCILIGYLWNKKLSHDENPFRDYFVRSPGPIELDKDKRKRILKNSKTEIFMKLHCIVNHSNLHASGFKPDRIPVNLDAIVIGSGVGGLVTAGCLARVGKRVLVLEQHGKAGGCTHTYKKKGYEFDVGMHIQNSIINCNNSVHLSS